MDKPAVRLVQVDNGGSSDISSYVAPSSLYLTFHQDGEMFDIDGSYLLTRFVAADLKVLEADLANGLITISYTKRDEDDFMKEKTVKAKLFIKEALQEVSQVRGDHMEYQLQSTVGLQSYID